MSHAAEEIASQPACWAAAADLVPKVAGLLPAPGERTAVVGCGTSYNMALAYAWLREEAGQGLTDAMSASELHPHRDYDRYLFISRSGTTSEILGALAQVPPGRPVTAFTVGERSPLAEAVPSVRLEFAHERSVVQTRFATSLLMLLRTHLGEDPGPLVEQAQRALAAPLPDGALHAERFTFLGRGWTVGLAHEAALKLREAAQAWTESYPAMEVRHGPISILDKASVVWCFGEPPTGLATDVQATGAGFVRSELDPLAELVRAQRLAVVLAGARGLDVDHPRNLSFSVVLGKE
jgi:fructoselysine-6-P-deglycase FrlB-like protein